MSRITCLTLLFCTFFLSGESLPSRTVVHDKRSVIPAGFASQGASSPDEDIVLSFNIASRDRDGLEAKLLAASTPGSPTFRQWLSKSEVESHAAPSSEALEAVQEWLSSNDINVPTSNSEPSNWLSVNVPISKANKLLSTTFEKFEHIPTHKNLNRVMQYSVPSNLAGVIKAVYPTTSFDVFDEPSPNESLNADAPTNVSSTTPAKRQELCDLPIKPSCLLDLYKVPRSANISTQSRIGIASLFLRNVSTTDLRAWLEAHRPDVDAGLGFNVLSVDGTQNDPTKPGTEGNLNMQWSTAMAPQIPKDLIMIANTTTTTTNTYIDIGKFMLAQSSPPQVFSISYGMAQESSLSPSMTQALCDTYMQLAARGVSVIWASGNGGVKGSPGNVCSSTGPFISTFPTCPYVTLIGASAQVPEIAWRTSAGGFSNYYPTQSWQASAVNGYLTQLGELNSGRFNRTGRAYPDISAMGDSLQYAALGDAVTFSSSGTSFSAPIVAGIIGLLNGELLAAGKPVLGFLNPWLYSHPEMFNDVTSGENTGCGPRGFPAAQGWDPVTGLGTPNYQKMKVAAGL